MKIVNLGYIVFFMAMSFNISWATYIDTSEPVPIERLIENMEQYIEDNPEDAHGYYVLGRVYSLGFAKMENINVTLTDNEGNPLETPRFRPYDSMLDAIVNKPATSFIASLFSSTEKINDQQIDYLKKSIYYYYQATTQNPNNALYYLGLGWMLEQALPYTKQLGMPPYELPWVDKDDKQHFLDHLKETLQSNRMEYIEDYLNSYTHNYFNIYKNVWDNNDNNFQKRFEPLLIELWRQECLWAYRQAFGNKIYQDVSSKIIHSGQPESNIGIEAGKGIIRVIGDEADEDRYAWEVEAINNAIATVSGGMSIITPIIFSLEQNSNMNSLLAPSTQVTFDLDGDYQEEQCAWLQPETAILVWDPEDGQQITSGRQLFGSVTWWMFWRNGYEAMNALDDDRDGWLRGDELEGLAIWQDRNQNGVSDDGEVTPISATEIAALATQPEVNQGQNISHSQGLKLNDGRVLPTYDWFPEQVR